MLILTALGRSSRQLLPSLLLLTLISPAFAREATTRPTETSVEFLSSGQAQSAIIDESMEPYFKLLQPMEMSVKTGEPIGDGTLEQQRDRCRKRYQDAVEEFTDEEKDALRWYVSKLAPLVENDYPLYARTPWSFLKLSPRFEGGMPHTRGSHIIIAENELAGLVQSRKHAPEWTALVRGATILLHEQLHVVQREHPRDMAKLYTEFWKFKHADAVTGCDWLTQHQIVNPDGVDVRWVYPLKQDDKTRWIWPLIILDKDADPEKATFADMRMVAVDVDPDGANSFKARVDPDGRPIMQSLNDVAEYASAFPATQEDFHPNEAAANLFAMIQILNRILPGHVPDGPDRIATMRKKLEPLNTWFEKVLADGMDSSK
ncbi:MAG TPA: hypothetical protein VLJ39_02105 [Tepidisphaeraceae bacterium]|nr:hypothetical protein [Tepidisphaeraceae bacterium]